MKTISEQIQARYIGVDGVDTESILKRSIKFCISVAKRETQLLLKNRNLRDENRLFLI